MALKNAAKVTYFGDTLFDLTQDSVAPGKVVKGITFHDKKGQPQTGTATDHGDYSITLTDMSPASIPNGFHSGAGEVSVNPGLDFDKANILEGRTILGETGTAVKLNAGDAGTYTPSTEDQIVEVPEGYNAISAVKIEKVPYAEATNDAGGLEITIGLD